MNDVCLTINSKTAITGNLNAGQLKRISELLQHFIDSNALYEREIKGKL